MKATKAEKTLNNSTDRNLRHNIIGSLGIKGLALIVSFFSLPLYINYFVSNEILGMWFTTLAILSWISFFDLGLGNGLRNNLTTLLSFNDYENAKKYISSTYIQILIIIVPITAIVIGLILFYDMNSLLKVNPKIITPKTMDLSLIVLVLGISVSFVLKQVSMILYALQKSYTNNLIALIVAILPLVYILISTQENTNAKFLALSIVYAISINIPLIVATIIVFKFTSMKKCVPQFSAYDKKTAAKVISLGMEFFVAQIFFLLIISTNEIIITRMYTNEAVVEYSIYFRLFMIIGSFALIGLTPVWSHITKAFAEKNYVQIRQINKKIMVISAISTLAEFLLIPFLTIAFHLWLGANAPEVNYIYAFVFAVYGSIYIFNISLTTIANGIGELKTQILFYGIGSALKLPIIIAINEIYDNWVVVIIANGLILLAFCIYQYYWLDKRMQKMIEKNINI